MTQECVNAGIHFRTNTVHKWHMSNVVFAQAECCIWSLQYRFVKLLDQMQIIKWTFANESVQIIKIFKLTCHKSYYVVLCIIYAFQWWSNKLSSGCTNRWNSSINHIINVVSKYLFICLFFQKHLFILILLFLFAVCAN